VDTQEKDEHVAAVLAQVEDLPLNDRWSVLERALELSTKPEGLPREPFGVVAGGNDKVFIYPHDEPHEHDWVVDAFTSPNGPRLHFIGSDSLNDLLDALAHGFASSQTLGMSFRLRGRDLQNHRDINSLKDVEWVRKELVVDWSRPHHGGCMGFDENGKCENPQCSYTGGEAGM
jgi:hypothetical protein